MLKIRKLLPNDAFNCNKLMLFNINEKAYFERLGWNLSQLKNQLLKGNNYSLGLFDNNLILSFIIGDMINVEKILEYEILLLYVNFNYRKLGHASKLLNSLPSFFGKNQLKKIYLEVSVENNNAIRLYKKNSFEKIGIRKNYYQIKNNKFDAIILEKKYE